MRTLKTISVILPMTLLLACGGGGGGGHSALPTGGSPQEIEPTVPPTTLTLTADSRSFVPDDVDIDDNDVESYTISTEAASTEVAPPLATERYNSGPYEFKRFGKWFHVTKTSDGSNFWFGKWKGDSSCCIEKGWYHAGENLGTQIKDNDEFAGAVYTGKSIVKRKRSHGGGIREGEARVEIDGSFDVIFSFTNIEGINDLKYRGSFTDDLLNYFDGYSDKSYHNTVETPDLRTNKRGKVKNGVSATFYGRDGDAIGGFFRDIGEGVKRGVFGATRDTVVEK